MPFWWRRRKRYWLPYNQYRKRRARRRYRRKPRYRRRTRKAVFRKRRRRRRKVRRKRKTITVKQWQPDSIVKCKIKGIGTLILGSQGRQLVCYTNVKKTLTPPKAPCGGGFACEQYSLGYLYEEYKMGNNIWTKSNIGKDLCRYLLVKFTFYRHPDTDFIISYDRQPPFNTDNLVYQSCHPKLLLLSRHKILLLSKFTKPNGKLKKRITIKPPKQMLTKWFFSEQFSKFPLLLLKAAACNFNYPNIGCCFQNQILTFFYLNTTFYKQGNWAYHSADTTPYRPYLHTSTYLYLWSKPYTGTEPEKKIEESEFSKYGITKYFVPTTYPTSIDYKTGWFSKQVLSCVAISTDSTWASVTALKPTNTCRYNPNVDSGKGNLIYLKSTLNTTWDPPKTDTILIVKELPLWLGLYGWLSYVIMTKKVQDFFDAYVVVIKSPALFVSSQPLENDLVIPLDTEFTQGKWPFDEPITHNEHNHWWPNVYHQLSILNMIVMSGPYVPKIDLSQTKNNTWELHYNYQFLFKWGGPETPDQPVTDPQQQPTYPVPDTLYSTIQVRDPEKLKFETIIHPWDYRRGIVKSSTLKRMSEHLSIDSTFEPDGYPVKKKQRTGPEISHPQEEDQEVLSCLQELFKESTFQETQEENLLQLIQQQQQQQQELKWNLLRIISELKDKQRQLQLQTGLLH